MSTIATGPLVRKQACALAPAAWAAEDLRAGDSWIFTLDERARRHLVDAVRNAGMTLPG